MVASGIEERVREVLRIVARQLSFREAYLFGSQAEGTAGEWSDIDIAVFADGIADWDLSRHLNFVVAVQLEAGEDVDLHLYPSRALAPVDASSFAGWIVSHGVRVYP